MAFCDLSLFSIIMFLPSICLIYKFNCLNWGNLKYSFVTCLAHARQILWCADMGWIDFIWKWLIFQTSDRFILSIDFRVNRYQIHHIVCILFIINFTQIIRLLIFKTILKKEITSNKNTKPNNNTSNLVGNVVYRYDRIFVVAIVPIVKVVPITVKVNFLVYRWKPAIDVCLFYVVIGL